MTVTKQQQLEWLAKECHAWKGRDFILVSDTELGYRLPVTAGCHLITRQEWQQERDKMSSKPEVDNSLRKRGARPPIGAHVELWFGGSFAYNCEFICVRGRNYIVWNLDADRPDCADIMNSEFRPLRTERDKAIDALIEIICANGFLAKDGTEARDIAERLYDAEALK